MKPRSLSEYEDGREDEIYNCRLQQINQRYNNAVKAIITFTLFSLVLAIYRYYITKDYVEDGIFYRAIRQIQYLNYTSLQAKEKQGKFVVSNQQLERFSWTLLQFSAASFPQQFKSQITDKFNSFLILFGQLYPCDKYKQRYFQALKQSGLFIGTTKKQVIVFLCQLHNKIRRKLGKTQDNCQKIQKSWSITS